MEDQPALSTFDMKGVSAHWVLMQISSLFLVDLLVVKLILLMGLDPVKLITSGGSCSS